MRKVLPSALLNPFQPRRSSSILDGVKLETPDLSLRPSALSDLELVHALWTHPEVRRYLFDDREISLAEASAFLSRSEASFRDFQYGIWLLFPKDVRSIGGFAGLLHAADCEPNLIFGTHPELWRHGYARQAASAVLRYAFDVLELPRVLADVDEPNVASIRLLEKLGMTRMKRDIVEGRPLLYYEIRRSAERAD